jgi:hypothetical protein
LCNLVNAPSALEEIFKGTAKGERILKIFLVLSMSEDEDTARYAACALANLV